MKIKLEPGAYIPERAHDTDAGLDLRSRERKKVPMYGSEIFDTGVHIALPPSTAGVLISKSGLNINHDITSTGLIDEGYTGSIMVKLFNHGKNDYVVKPGEKISQLVILPILRPEMELVSDLEATERGDNGFGSTGR